MTSNEIKLQDEIIKEEIISDDQTTLYIVTKDFATPTGAVSGTSGIPCDDEYVIEEGWFLYDLQTGVHIIDDIDEIGEWDQDDMEAAKKYVAD